MRVSSIVLPLALCAPLAAQLPPPQQTTPPAPAPAPESAEPTPQERVDKLKAEVEKLQQELEQIKEIEQDGGIRPRVKEFLGARAITARSIAAPTPPPPAATPPAATDPDAGAGTGRHGVRLLSAEEKATLGDGVLFTVDGVPTTQAELDAAVAFLEESSTGGDAAQLKQRAVMELVKVKAALAAFPEGAQAARQRIESVRNQLAGETEFAALAQEHSDCPSKSAGGDLGFFGRSTMEFGFARAAFALEPGDVSEPVASSTGYHLIKATGEQAADTDEARIRASHILAMYTTDQLARSRVMQRALSGQVDLAFASEELQALAPAAFR